MELHDRAWQGFKILILAKTPMLAMKLEQSIASALPAMEVQLYSYETYDQAYQFCKEQQDVGFFFIAEDAVDAPFSSVFRELAKQYKTANLPAFGVILHEGEEKAFALKQVGKIEGLLDYLPTSALLERTQTTMAIRGIWEQLINAYENSIFSKNLQNSILSAAEDEIGLDSVHFILRVSANLSSELNLTWVESVASRWGNILAIVDKKYPAILKPHEHLQYLHSNFNKGLVSGQNDLTSLLAASVSPAEKVFALTQWLQELRQNNKLEEGLNSLASLAKPGAPKLIRHIAKNQGRIIEFANDATHLYSEQKA
jgi:hypothetical protein